MNVRNFAYLMLSAGFVLVAQPLKKADPGRVHTNNQYGVDGGNDQLSVNPEAAENAFTLESTPINPSTRTWPERGSVPPQVIPSAPLAMKNSESNRIAAKVRRPLPPRNLIVVSDSPGKRE